MKFLSLHIFALIMTSYLVTGCALPDSPSSRTSRDRYPYNQNYPYMRNGVPNYLGQRDLYEQALLKRNQDESRKKAAAAASAAAPAAGDTPKVK